MKKGLVCAIAGVLCICLSSCGLKRLGYVYKSGSWYYVSRAAFAFGYSQTNLNEGKKDLKILADEAYACGKENVYYEGEVIENADPTTFRIIDNDYAVDKEFVYFRKKIVQNADPDSFHIISEDYAADKDQVFVFIRESYYPIYGADTASFEALESPYSKDKNDAYCGNLPLFVDDVTKFHVIETGSDWRTPTYEQFLNEVANNSWYNHEKYEFATESILYSETGRAKTETLNYYGYLAVEEYDPFHLKIYADLTPFGLGKYELRHEGKKKLYDLTQEMEQSKLRYIPESNIRYYENWDSHKGQDVVYDVIDYEGTYIIVAPVLEKSSGYNWCYIYLCKEIDKDVDMFKIGIKDLAVVEKLLELPSEQMSRKELVEKLGKPF